MKLQAVAERTRMCVTKGREEAIEDRTVPRPHYQRTTLHFINHAGGTNQRGVPDVQNGFYRSSGRLPGSVGVNASGRTDTCRVTDWSRARARAHARVTDLQYADDCAILTHTVEELQTSLDLRTEAYQSPGLSISIKNQDHISTRPRQH